MAIITHESTERLHPLNFFYPLYSFYSVDVGLFDRCDELLRNGSIEVLNR